MRKRSLMKKALIKLKAPKHFLRGTELGNDDKPDEDELTAEEQELKAWSIENWPAYTTDAQDALKRLRDMESPTHKVNPVRIFDQLGLVPPS
ncbi:hypothetical protein ONZ45_g12951 [Pleurotus djamor]|nr:hypothetical protein ONZ45_g12951 [Pleurotus djamor]